MDTTDWIEVSEPLRRHQNGTGGAHRLHQRLNIGLRAAQKQSKRTQAGMNDDSLAGLYSARTKRVVSESIVSGSVVCAMMVCSDIWFSSACNNQCPDYS